MASDQDTDSRFSDPISGSIALLRRWWRMVCREIDQVAVIEKVRGESGWTPRYAFMTCMSAGIAILGMLLSSPAVVIGAMLLSPLMGPILGIGFALAVGDFRWLRDAGRALGLGTILAILFCAIIVAMSPLQTITSEIAARTRPNLFDLGVALFSALAGAYAMIRGRDGTIVGVAIATALMPPLAAIGFGLATFNWAVFGGASFLFFTNLTTIALTAAVMARTYGFSTYLSAKQTWAQSVVIISVFVALAIPLGFSLRQISWEANATRQAQELVGDEFGPEARISQLDFDFDADPITVTASVLTPEIVGGAEERAQRTLQRELGRNVMVDLRQFQVDTEETADGTELALARMREQAAATREEIADLTDRLALIAGVNPDEVTVDRNTRRAIVRVRALPGAELETYYALEQRANGRAEDWDVQVIPPAKDLPAISFADGEPDAAGQRNMVIAIWAAERLAVPVGVSGSDAAAAIVIERMENAGIDVRRLPGAQPGFVALSWLAPDGGDDE
ncbi:DUF389 domain-containing protein [Parasphingopyxis sp.]|uniref:DUF389 domain-containing protein n=1 Tax=Parasphingopyxis sp. TaxID=1920299 RepID=UPI00262D1215|nr:DUF389 domain-containing protein [Parasphingopyxis sp.]